LAFHQQAADQLRCNLLGGASEEGLGKVLGGCGGYGSGYGGWVEAIDITSATKSKVERSS